MLTGAFANLVLNGLIVVLLTVTIMYCWVLNRRIRILQDSRSELAQLLRHFDDSTKRAADSILALQSASKKIGETIQSRMEKANFLLDDLAFMMEKGEKTANQLEASMAVNRAQTRVMAEQARSKPDQRYREKRHEPEVRAAERKGPIEDNLPGAIELPKSLQKNSAKEKSVAEKTAASLEAVLERVSIARQQPVDEEAVKTESPRQKQNTRLRSRVEQELLDLIKTGMKG